VAWVLWEGIDGAIIVADCAELVTFAQTEPLNKMLMDWQSKKRGGLPLIPVVFFANKVAFFFPVEIMFG
jgi:signal recognition particle receptor subunit beta